MLYLLVIKLYSRVSNVNVVFLPVHGQHHPIARHFLLILRRSKRQILNKIFNSEPLIDVFLEDNIFFYSYAFSSEKLHEYIAMHQ